jgi:transposase
MPTTETVQTFLTAAEIDQLVGDYVSGMRIDELAERYGVYRATVFAHLRRRNVPRRPVGLDEADWACA